MAAKRRIDLRVTGAGQRRAAMAAHRRAVARRNMSSQPRRGCVRTRLCPATCALAVPERRDSIAATLWNTPVYPRRRHRQRAGPDSAAATANVQTCYVRFRIMFCRGLGVACSLPSTSPGATMYTTREGMATTRSTPFCICVRFRINCFVNPVVQSCTMNECLVAVQHLRVPTAHAIPSASMATAY